MVETLLVLANGIVRGAEEILRVAKTEEDLRIQFEKLLEPIKNELNLKSKPEYEKHVYSGRIDAVHGHLIIEYKSPRAFSSKKNVDSTYDQLVSYLNDIMNKTKKNSLIGIGFDGEKIFFVKNKDGKWIKEPDAIDSYEFNLESAKTFLIYLRSLSRLPLTAEKLAQKFGPQSELASKVISAFVNALKNWGNQTRIQTFFDEWKRIFGIIYGEQFSNIEKETIQRAYRVSSSVDIQELMFSIHTYFAFLMKVLVAELVTMQETKFSSSLATKFTHLSDDDLKRELEDIENGGIYAKKGITNFLEGDFFRWYLDAFDSKELKDNLREIFRAISEFEPATSIIESSYTRDLLKKLYQYLVPQEVRHRLGEYYTPDWLAELLLNEIGYDGDMEKRLLDPACGSGTFLVLAIQRAIEYGRKKKKQAKEIAENIFKNIWGFDLNPLAVIASRTNYLFAMGDLLHEFLDKSKNIEIPVYLTDSVLTPTRTDVNLYGEFLEITTSVGKFQIPADWIRDLGNSLNRATQIIEAMVKNRFSVDQAIEKLEKEKLVFPQNREIIKSFYSQILELDKQNKNSIWMRFLKNAFAPVMAGKFDFVVGNPPWIRWDYLSQDYRKATKQLWVDYHLFSLKGYEVRLGGGVKDFSKLFTYVSSDCYLKDGAKLAFLITQEVFKAKGAGEGFRRFQLKNGKFLKVLKVHDLVSLKPFEKAANKTAMIVLQKGEKTTYPVEYFVWSKKKGAGKISPDKLFSEVEPLLRKERFNAKPIDSNFGSWQHYSENDVSYKIQGKNQYKAYTGANIEPYGVFLLKIKNVLSSNEVIIENLPEEGKVKISKSIYRIEQDLVYPALRGRDIKRWKAQPEIFVLLTQDPTKREPYPEDIMKKNCPRTYEYLTKFKELLLLRKSKALQDLAKKTSFYAILGVSNHTMSKFKVVWKRMSNDIVAAVISVENTPIGYKTIIPLGTTAFIPTDNEDEAHYLCAILNSKPVRDFIKSYSSAGRGFGSPSVMEYVGIPKFDSQNPLHKKLSENSKKCHDFKKTDNEKEIKNLEEKNDELVKELFGIK
ncbi:MAG: N-6 DNA methylase [Leptospiraceae bacterium]|nr:N-6 DNA methylase [Leptospiraceae bacterium]MDW7974979.1 N-6 DNA methylase [Leptospiraceae bacterium]